MLHLPRGAPILALVALLAGGPVALGQRPYDD